MTALTSGDDGIEAPGGVYIGGELVPGVAVVDREPQWIIEVEP